MMMMNEILLQHKIDPDQYVTALNIAENETTFVTRHSEYIEILPRYTVARCPICGEIYLENLDTYTLRHWRRARYGKSLFMLPTDEDGNKNQEIIRCGHFMVVHHFINLNNIIPRVSETELYFNEEFNSEVPHVLPMLFLEELGCRAVIHSLPICRIEEDKFIPRYTLYMISYFASEERHDAVIKRIIDEGNLRYDDWFDLLLPPPDADDGLIWWDLKHWVKEGKLFWIEPDNPDTPLVKGPVEDFPYGEISGRKKPYFVDIPPEKLG